MSWLRVTYRVVASPAEIDAIARAIALEQSVEVPLSVVRDAFVADAIVGRVESIVPVQDAYDVVILLSEATTGGDAAQTLNMLFGNSSLHEHVTLVDVEFPPSLLARLGGPRFGIEGIRDAVGAHGRPLTCAALKPQGLASERLAELCHALACAGIDVIKDDHGLADQAYSRFAHRVAACQRSIDRAHRETGRRALYAPSVVGSPSQIAMQARLARDEGAGMLLVAPALVGMPAFHELVQSLDVPVLAHPAYAGAARVDPPWLLGAWFRLLGADAVIYPNFGGRFAYGRERCAAIAERARRPWSNVRPVLPVPAGGLSVERVPELVKFYGPDAMLLIGGSLLAAADALPARARAFAESVAAASTSPVRGEGDP